MVAILHISVIVIVVAIVHMHPQVILLAMTTLRKSIHGFPLLSCMGMGFHLCASLGCQTLSIIINKNYIVFEKEQNFQFLFKLTIHFQEIPPPKKKKIAKTLITDIQGLFCSLCYLVKHFSW